ncbi:MAG: hypothetical protein ACTTKL_04590 [Treponema sp.]
MDFIQVLGYAASFIIFVSLTMKSIVKLRILNALGCLVFVIFALKTNSIPAVVMNIGIVFIDMYYLYGIVRTKDTFEMVAVQKDNDIVRYFFEKNKDEMNALFGEDALSAGDAAALFFRNNDIAGIVAYSIQESGDGKRALITADFVVPKYRDLAIGRRFFVEDVSYWKERGCTSLESANASKVHIAYLKRLGFAFDAARNIWKKKI